MVICICIYDMYICVLEKMIMVHYLYMYYILYYFFILLKTYSDKNLVNDKYLLVGILLT